MSTIIADCYSNELDNWSELICFYREQITLLKQRLFQATKSQSMLKDGARIEKFQILIIQFYDLFYEIENEINHQVSQINRTYIVDDFVLNESIENRQQIIRYKMFLIEKNYLNLRYILYSYLMKTLKQITLNRHDTSLNLLRI